MTIVDEFLPTVPDPHAVGGLGLAQYCGACTPALMRHLRSDQDALREAHMAAELRALLARVTGRVLFLCGMAHWLPVRAHLERGDGALHDSVGVPAEQVQIVRASARSIPRWMGDLPYLVECYERHRAGFELDDYDPVHALRRLLLVARERFLRRFPGSLEEPDPPALRTVLDYARRMMVRRRLLIPDSYRLVVAAHGVVGNDFAIVVSELANRYAPNGELRFTDGDFDPDDATSATEERATDLGGG